MSFLRPILGRIAGTVAGAIIAWLVASGVEIDAATQEQIRLATDALMLAVYGIVYAIVHRLWSKRFNPADAAAPELVQAGKQQQAIIRHGADAT